MKMRNCLIVLACLRLARRSNELRNMTIDQYENSEVIEEDGGENHHMILVNEQKDEKRGNSAPIV